MVNHGYAKPRILEKIDLCIVLCANCHRREHVKLPGWWDAEQISEKSWGDLSIDELLRKYPVKDEVKTEQEYRGRIRAWAHQYKAVMDGCNRCPEDDPVCIEFHHRDGDEKSHTIGIMIELGPSQDRMMEEINKCEFFCRNCHRKEHLDPPKPFARTED